MHTTDIDIELQLRAMFMVMRLPSLEKITVKVEDSFVELGGSVLTHFEKMYARTAVEGLKAFFQSTITFTLKRFMDRNNFRRQAFSEVVFRGIVWNAIL